jgi:hypothetical protein
MKTQKYKAQPTFLEYLTDDFGVWEHAHRDKILKEEGYALDDPARALIVYLLFGKKDKARVCLGYIESSLKDGLFWGEFTDDRKPFTFPSSEDAFGLALWALAYAKSVKFEVDKVDEILGNVNLDYTKEVNYLRPNSYYLIAFTLLGLRERADMVFNKIMEHYDITLGWFEPKLIYANAAIPLSLIKYINHYGIEGKELESKIETAIETLDKHMRIGVIPAPPGNVIWQEIGSGVRDIQGQQPIEAGFMVLLLCEAYNFFREERYKTKAKEWLDWFYGNNIVKQSLINENYACADGIDQDRVSDHNGSESTIMYLWANKIYFDTFGK